MAAIFGFYIPGIAPGIAAYVRGWLGGARLENGSSSPSFVSDPKIG